MQIFGWIVLLIVSFGLSGFYLLVCTQTLGQYNIGGVPTTIKGKLATLLAGGALIWWWFKIFEWAPFVITPSA